MAEFQTGWKMWDDTWISCKAKNLIQFRFDPHNQRSKAWKMLVHIPKGSAQAKANERTEVEEGEEGMAGKKERDRKR